MESVKKKRCVIVLAGEIKNEDAIKSNVFYDDFVIAADGGYLKCLSAGVKPDLIIGDFDSSELPDADIPLIKLNPIKDSTDAEAAALEAEKRGFDKILFLGALGGREDHSYANLALTASMKQKNISAEIIDENHLIYALKNESRVTENRGQYVSVYAFGGECTVTLEGFFYPLKDYKLSPFSAALGTSNELVGSNGKITVTSGTALVIEANKAL